MAIRAFGRNVFECNDVFAASAFRFCMALVAADIALRPCQLKNRLCVVVECRGRPFSSLVAARTIGFLSSGGELSFVNITMASGAFLGRFAIDKQSDRHGRLMAFRAFGCLMHSRKRELH
jgi:hypothetical protein